MRMEWPADLAEERSDFSSDEGESSDESSDDPNDSDTSSQDGNESQADESSDDPNDSDASSQNGNESEADEEPGGRASHPPSVNAPCYEEFPHTIIVPAYVRDEVRETLKDGPQDIPFNW